MRIISNEELSVVSGGVAATEGGGGGNWWDGFCGWVNDFFGGGGGGGYSNTGSSSSGDQRNQDQKDAQARADAAVQACGWLGNATCVQAAKATAYYIAAEKYAICRSEGGVDGPDDCGTAPKSPFKRK